MNKQDVDRIINETSFSMEVEGFILPKDEKVIIREMLNGNISFTAQLQKYIDNAKRSGGILNASSR